MANGSGLQHRVGEIGNRDPAPGIDDTLRRRAVRAWGTRLEFSRAA